MHFYFRCTRPRKLAAGRRERESKRVYFFPTRHVANHLAREQGRWTKEGCEMCISLYYYYLVASTTLNHLQFLVHWGQRIFRCSQASAQVPGMGGGEQRTLDSWYAACIGDSRTIVKERGDASRWKERRVRKVAIQRLRLADGSSTISFFLLGSPGAHALSIRDWISKRARLKSDCESLQRQKEPISQWLYLAARKVNAVGRLTRNGTLVDKGRSTLSREREEINVECQIV